MTRKLTYTTHNLRCTARRLCHTARKFRYTLILALALVATLLSCHTRMAAHGAVSAVPQIPVRITGQEAVGLTIAPDRLPEQMLYRKGYVASYNWVTRQPNWVAWHLTAEHVDGTFERQGNPFHEDLEVPEPRAYNSDYRGTGWSRGHLCPAADNKWDPTAMYESFLLTNVCPQDRALNSGVWNQIEISCRRWAKKYGDVYIVSGPVFLNRMHETLGPNRVVVPEAFFKVIVCLNGPHPKGIGFICRNNDGNRRKDLHVNTIAQVERVTKYTFFPNLPPRLAAQIKNAANLDDW